MYFFEEPPIKVQYENKIPVESEELKSQSELNKSIIIFLPKNNGKQIGYSSRPIKYQEKVYIAPFPNPVHLLLNVAIENYNNSIEPLKQLIEDCLFDNSEHKIHVLNIYHDNTNKNYNDIVKYRITSILTLVTSLEAFMNQILPNNFVYMQLRKDKIYRLKKNQIESTKVSFNEKLINVMAQFKRNSKFYEENQIIIDGILKVYTIRRQLVHLKTNSQDLQKIYLESVGDLLDLDIFKSIHYAKEYIYQIDKHFIK